VPGTVVTAGAGQRPVVSVAPPILTRSAIRGISPSPSASTGHYRHHAIDDAAELTHVDGRETPKPAARRDGLTDVTQKAPTPGGMDPDARDPTGNCIVAAAAGVAVRRWGGRGDQIDQSEGGGAAASTSALVDGQVGRMRPFADFRQARAAPVVDRPPG
jgi:hypothetical protein